MSTRGASTALSKLQDYNGFSRFVQLAQMPCGTIRVTWTQGTNAPVTLETRSGYRNVLTNSRLEFCSADLAPVPTIPYKKA